MSGKKKSDFLVEDKDMFIADGPKTPNPVHRVHSCSDLQTTGESARFRHSRLFPSGSPPYSAQASRAGTPAFLPRFDPQFSFPQIVAAVANFFKPNKTISEDRRASFELFKVGATKSVDPDILANIYKIRVCKKTSSGWEGVSLDPLYAGSVFIVSETLGPLHFSKHEAKTFLKNEEPTLDPNCKYCSLADSDDSVRGDSKRKKWMEECFASFDENAGFFLKTMEAEATVAFPAILEPNDDIPRGRTVCDDCRELLAPFDGREPVQSVDYSPTVFRDERALYTYTVTREFDPSKFERYCRMKSPPVFV